MAQLTAIDDDEVATEEAASLLLRELRPLDGIVSLRRASTTVAPGGARTGELVDLGALLAVLAAHGDLVSGVLTTAGAWLRRRGRGRVEVRIGEHHIILDNATADEQHRLTEAFIDRVFPPGR